MVSGGGTLTLTGFNAYSGGTVVSQGTLELNSTTAAGAISSAITLGDANTGSASVALAFGPGISSTDLTIDGRTLRDFPPITVANTGSSGTATIVLNQGAFLYTDVTLNRATIFTGSSGGNGLMGQFTGSGAGAGNNTLIVDPGSGNTLALNAKDTGLASIANTFVGNVLINSGTLQTQNLSYVANIPANQNLVIPDTSSVTVESGALWILAWGDETIDALNGGGTVQMHDFTGPHTLTVGGGGGSGNFSGTLAGINTALAKIGSGTETLSGSNSYAGGTSIGGGTLAINADVALGAVPASPATNITFFGNGTLQFARGFTGSLSPNRGIVVNSGVSATLDTNGNTITGGDLTLASSATLTKTDSSGTGVFEFDTAPMLAASSSLQVNSGTLRFNVNSGSASIGPGVTATVASGATLELAGSVAGLSQAANIINNSTAAATGGLYVSGVNQQASTITGTGMLGRRLGHFGRLADGLPNRAKLSDHPRHGECSGLRHALALRLRLDLEAHRAEQYQLQQHLGLAVDRQ